MVGYAGTRVVVEGLAVQEALLAGRALVRANIRVQLLVLVQPLLLRKAAAASAALVGSHPSVGQQVRLKLVSTAELLAATQGRSKGALELLDRVVHQVMPLEFVLSVEGGPTLGTEERLLRGVHHCMNLEVVVRLETLVAN